MRGFSKTDALGFFIAGAAVGAAVGLLLAPKSGAQTRKEISRFSKKTINKLDDLQCDVREQITEGYEQVMEVFDNVKDYVEDGKNKLQRMMRTA
jgi:gas vesicle protein